MRAELIAPVRGCATDTRAFEPADVPALASLMYRAYLDIAARHGFVALMGGLDYRASPDSGSAIGARFSVDDPLLPAWRDVAANLTAYPVEATDGGLKVAANVSFDIPHRHWSHLFAIMPLHDWTWRGADAPH